MEHQNTYESDLISAMNRVYILMFLGLLITTASALMVVYVPSVRYMIFSSAGVVYGLLIGELILVLVISAAIGKMSSSTAMTLFVIYAIINGLTLSVIFFVYELGSIYAAFGVTALTFATMSFIGATTKRDLSNLRGYLMMGLIGVIIASIVNLFLGNSAFDVLISMIAVLVFIGLTAYDTQYIKRLLEDAESDVYTDTTEVIRKIAIIGALKLYLDFINLFLQILRLMGKKK